MSGYTQILEDLIYVVWIRVIITTYEQGLDISISYALVYWDCIRIVLACHNVQYVEKMLSMHS